MRTPRDFSSSGGYVRSPAMSARRFVFLGLVLVACTPAAKPAPAPPAATAAPPPPPRKAPVVAAARKPVVHTYFGVNVTDDYEWLEEANAPETKGFTDAQKRL